MNPARAQSDELVFHAAAEVVEVRRGPTGALTQWRLAPELDPDVLKVDVPRGERREVCFLSGGESFCRSVAAGEHVDFTIRFDGIDHPTRILGVAPAAVFDEAYREAHRGTISVTVPEVYEMVNVAIALTPFAREREFLVRKDTPYYEDVLDHFADVIDHPFVAWLDEELREGMYHQHKMNGYAFVFDDSGRVERSPVYNSTNFTNRPNTLLPVLDEMRSFAEASDFRSFYRAHRALYEEQERFLRDELGLERMLDWLERNFPDIASFDHVNVVFSPLVYGGQSLTGFRHEGFSEIQPHVNFPYPSRREGDDALDPASLRLRRGSTVFTELNHGFINPTAVRHRDRITTAMEDRTYWVEEESPAAASYNFPVGVFNEMMNWALVSLYYVDSAPADDVDRLVAQNATEQAEVRGFRRAPGFHAFLVDLYRDRSEGTTLAELYPEIVGWFGTQEEVAGPLR